MSSLRGLHSVIKDVFVRRKTPHSFREVFVVAVAESFNLVFTLVECFNQFLPALTHDMLCVIQRKILRLHYMLVKCWDFLNIISIESI